MRLSAYQRGSVIAAVDRVARRPARVWLFGSRTDDEARGGDVDLLVESDPPLSLRERARLAYMLEGDLSLPVDISVVRSDAPSDDPFVEIARQQSILLERE